MSAPSPVESIFFAALAQPTPEARAAYLTAACGPDADLRRRVDRLLTAHPHAGDFLEHPPAAPTESLSPSPRWGEGLGVRGDTTADPNASPEAPGTRIGPYKLLQKLGEGGMGTVWVAEQSDPVKRRVALKVIKPGMDSARVVARFEAERQALALMDHTNIAKVFDGGTTGEPGALATGVATGVPYFVMELVKGVPVTTYCDELHLSIRERLDLFVQVCAAVQHAHQKGVIHRDLKPSNVLVAVQDGKPVPKVIDFGVAKALHTKLADRTLYTEIGAVIGTLEYMAPEQAELSALDVDTRADIYALGTLLYELLTGSTPLTHDRLKQAGFAEILRLIREEEPPRPSTRLTQSKESIAALAAKRRTEPRRLSSEVRGDLDWIVMKCLEKDRIRRYETANGLARDVQRLLADEPVEARPPTTRYRLRKFLRRNKGPVLAATVLLLALLTGIAGTTWGLIRADAARAAEATQRAAAEEARNDEEKAHRQADDLRQKAERQYWREMLERDRRECEELDNRIGILDELRKFVGEANPDRDYIQLLREAEQLIEGKATTPLPAK